MNMDQPPEQKAVPDIRRAVAKGLQAVAALKSNQEVVDWFSELVGKVVGKFVPIDPAGIVNAKCQREAGNEIKQLLSED